MPERMFVSSGAIARPGHMARILSGGAYYTQDNQKEIVPAVVRERLRRDLYAHCDRAPFGWETRQ